MMSLTTRLFLLEPDGLENALGAGGDDVIAAARASILKTSLPADVREQVADVAEDLLRNGAGDPHLDLVRTLAVIGILDAIAEEVEMDTLEAVPGLQGVFRAMGDVIDYNLDAHLFGNPPMPFKAIDTAGTPLDIGYLDGDEVEELNDVLEGLEVTDEDLEEFSEEYSIELLEELVEPMMDALSQALSSGRDLIFVTEG